MNLNHPPERLAEIAALRKAIDVYADQIWRPACRRSESARNGVYKHIVNDAQHVFAHVVEIAPPESPPSIDPLRRDLFVVWRELLDESVTLMAAVPRSGDRESYARRLSRAKRFCAELHDIEFKDFNKVISSRTSVILNFCGHNPEAKDPGLRPRLRKIMQRHGQSRLDGGVLISGTFFAPRSYEWEAA